MEMPRKEISGAFLFRLAWHILTIKWKPNSTEN
jgi:hypothetical protein